MASEHSRTPERRYTSHAFSTCKLETWDHKVTDKIVKLVPKSDQICDEAASLESRGEVAVHVGMCTKIVHSSTQSATYP